MHGCPSCSKMTRREWLVRAASWAAFAALARRGDAQVISAGPQVRGTARACIFVYLNGAPSHLDTFDVKDAAWNPADIDIQQHGNIALSNTLFPKLSTLTDDLCILRSVRTLGSDSRTRNLLHADRAPVQPRFPDRNATHGSGHRDRAWWQWADARLSVPRTRVALFRDPLSWTVRLLRWRRRPRETGFRRSSTTTSAATTRHALPSGSICCHGWTSDCEACRRTRRWPRTQPTTNRPEG